MPNIFVQRYYIHGPPDIISEVLKNHFFLEGDHWESRGLIDNDPLKYQIADSGPFVYKDKVIAFSSYMGWHMHPNVLEHMAKHLPKGTILQVVGFDMDDYPSDIGGELCMFEGQSGRLLKHKTYPSQVIAQKYFPLLYQQLE